MDEIFTRVAPLPVSISGYTVRDRNGDFNIILNDRLTHERQMEAYNHELRHIQRGDFNRGGKVDLIEIYAHKGR